MLAVARLAKQLGSQGGRVVFTDEPAYQDLTTMEVVGATGTAAHLVPLHRRRTRRPERGVGSRTRAGLCRYFGQDGASGR